MTSYNYNPASGRDEHARALSAIHVIPADLSREDWVKVCMAAKDAGLTEAEVDDWSQSAPEKYNATSFRDVWRSIKGGQVTAASLFRMARDYGWTDSRSTSAAASNDGNVIASYRALLAGGPNRASERSNKPTQGVTPADVWKRLQPATNEHPYIVAKRGQGAPLENLRVVPADDTLHIMREPMAGALVVPCWDGDRLATLQFITVGDTAARLKSAGKPTKLNLAGSSVQGWHTVGEVVPGGRVHVCEGIGQAWACWQATGHAAVVAFGVGNMGKVAAALRQQDPAAFIVLVPDKGKEESSAKIAGDVGAAVVCMPKGEADNFDCNDLAKRDGVDVLADLLTSAIEPNKPEPILRPVGVFDVLTHSSPPQRFAWDGYAPSGVVTLWAAHGGVGKSTCALMLAVAVAIGRPLFGVPTGAPSCAVFVSLEDGADIVRRRLASICRAWAVNPYDLANLRIVDGTDNPELFSAENSRGAGMPTPTHIELVKLAAKDRPALIVVDNASDAFGGDEINRRQVRGFMRQLTALAKACESAVVLLAHVDKNTSRAGTPENSEGYSGSTAWNNSARSRLFMTRKAHGLVLEHQKSNLGQLREPLKIAWPAGGLPDVSGGGVDFAGLNERAEGREDDIRAAAILRMLDEYASRGQYASPAPTSRMPVHTLLKADREFIKLGMQKDDTRRIVTQCQRVGWLAAEDYRTPDRKPHQKWVVTESGRLYAGLPAPTAPSCAILRQLEDGAQNNMAQEGAPTAPSCA